jgi:hypothetical protein
MRPVKYSEVDDQSDEANPASKPEPKMQRPTKQQAPATDEEEENHQRPTPIRIVMQYLARSTKVKRHYFDNVASASRRTGVNADLLQGVCDDGGGFLGGFWFSYHENDVPKKTKDFFHLASLIFPVSSHLKRSFGLAVGGNTSLNSSAV